MYKETFDFYDRTSLKSYNLNESMRYQLNMLDKLDVFTRKHCENVAALTCRLCEKLHLNKGFTEYCTICAYLHDLGKQFIPPSVLQKPGKLTDEEYEIMKTHTTLGYELCMKDLQLRPYATGALNHHEALNGTGYPNGITKKDIPYEAQIIRVADEYDAIVSKRQYKSHIGISDTLKILIENANNGKNNPKIVKKLLKVVIDDIEYEISCMYDYVKDLSKEIDRYNTINRYAQKRDKTKNERKKAYFEEYMKIYLHPEETLEEYENLFKETQEAYELRKNILNDLYKEIKIIKRFRV
jgi:response regulator RpfG family c-di-GMP phosphodiesterase